MKFWHWLLWWKRPAVKAEQRARDKKVEEATEYATRVTDRIDAMADEYRRAERALRRHGG